MSGVSFQERSTTGGNMRRVAMAFYGFVIIFGLTVLFIWANRIGR